MSSLFDDLKQGLEEAISYEKGNGSIYGSLPKDCRSMGMRQNTSHRTGVPSARYPYHRKSEWNRIRDCKINIP